MTLPEHFPNNSAIAQMVYCLQNGMSMTTFHQADNEIGTCQSGITDPLNWTGTAHESTYLHFQIWQLAHTGKPLIKR